MQTSFTEQTVLPIFVGMCVAAFGMQFWWLRKVKFARSPWPIWILAVLLLGLGWRMSEQAGRRERNHVQSLTEAFAQLYGDEMEKRGHWRLSNDVAGNDSLYLNLIETEKTWEKLNPGLSDIYTLRKLPNGENVFMVDSETDYNRNGKYDTEREQRTPIGEVYGNVDQGLESAFRGQANVDFTPITDRWGTWVSAYVPLHDPSGRVEGALGVDFDARDFAASILDAKLRVISLVGLLLLALLGASTLISVLRAQIAERKRIEEQLRVQVTALDSAANAIVITDHNGTIQSVNTAFTTLTGYTAREAIGKNPRILKGGKHDGAFYQIFWQTISSGRVWTGELTNRRKDGSLFVEEMTVTPVRNADGVIARYIAIKQDVTGRKQTEEALKERVRMAALEAEVGTALTRSGTLAEMLRLCCEAIVTHLGAAFARIWALNEREKMLELRASAGMYTHLDGPHGRVPVGKFKIGLIAEERKPHLTNQVVGDARVSDQEWAKREGMMAFAGYPMLIEDHLVGVVAMFARHPLTEATLTALASIANNIALGIERKRVEEAVRESEDKFRQLAANVTDVFYMTSPDMQQVHYASPAYEQIWGRTTESVYANPHQWAEAILPEDRERVWATFGRLVADERSASAEFRITRPDGTVRWIFSRGFQVRDSEGKVIRITGIASDITVRKNAEDDLRERVKLQDQIVQTAASVPGMIFTFQLRPDGSTCMPYASGALWDIFELHPRDVAENATPLFSLIHPDDIKHVQATIAESARTLNPWWCDFRVRQNRLEEIWAEGRSVSKREPDGSILWHGFIQDITERKRLEDQVIQSQKMETVGKLAGGIAHEFNSILTAIIGQSELLLGDLPSGNPLTKNANEISKAADRAATLTRQLLAYGRKQILRPETLDLNTVLAGMDGHVAAI